MQLLGGTPFDVLSGTALQAALTARSVAQDTPPGDSGFSSGESSPHALLAPRQVPAHRALKEQPADPWAQSRPWSAPQQCMPAKPVPGHALGSAAPSTAAVHPPLQPAAPHPLQQLAIAHALREESSTASHVSVSSDR